MMCCWNLMLIPFKTGPKFPKSMRTLRTCSMGVFFSPAGFQLLPRAWKLGEIEAPNGAAPAQKRCQAWKGVTSQTFSMLCPTHGAAPIPGKLQIWEAPNPPSGSALSQAARFVEFSPCAGIPSPPPPRFGSTFKGALLHFSNLGRGSGHRFFRVWSRFRPCSCRERRCPGVAVVSPTSGTSRFWWP